MIKVKDMYEKYDLKCFSYLKTIFPSFIVIQNFDPKLLYLCFDQRNFNATVQAELSGSGFGRQPIHTSSTPQLIS